MNQDHYIDSIEFIDLTWFALMSKDDNLDESGQALFRSNVGALNWLAVQTRPDIAYEVMELSTCFKKATMRNLKEVNKCIKMVKSESGLAIIGCGHVSASSALLSSMAVHDTS